MAELSRSGKIASVTTLWALLFVMRIAADAATSQLQTWEVMYDYTSPEKLNIVINGGSQAPTFFAQKNDIIILEVKNCLHTENLFVDLFGVRQIEDPWFGATQNPTVPGKTFRKVFVVDKPGKYIYDYYGILKREAALYISIHVSDRKSEPSFNGYDQRISEKLKPMVHSSRIMKKRTVAVRFQAENPGMNYQGDMLPSPSPPSPTGMNYQGYMPPSPPPPSPTGMNYEGYMPPSPPNPGYMPPSPLPPSPTGMNYEGYIPSNPPPPIPTGINYNYEGFMPPVAPPPPTGTRFSLKAIVLIGASLTISLAVAFNIQNICIWCPSYSSTGERR